MSVITKTLKHMFQTKHNIVLTRIIHNQIEQHITCRYKSPTHEGDSFVNYSYLMIEQFIQQYHAHIYETAQFNIQELIARYPGYRDEQWSEDQKTAVINELNKVF